MKIALKAEFDLHGFKEAIQLFPGLIDQPVTLELQWRNITFNSVEEVVEFLKIELAREKANTVT